MFVIKKINHNALLIDDNGKEKVAMGKGIGFSAKVGDLFDTDQADKLFVLDSKDQLRLFSDMASQIPLEHIEFAEEMIELIKQTISQPLDSNIYIALTDHISFAIQRGQDDKQTTAIMLSEMSLLYPTEFRVAAEIVEKINTRFQTNLADNEVGFITMHIVNAEMGEKNSLKALKIMEMTAGLMQIIEEQKQICFDPKSLHYNRMMIHLRFLAKRIIFKEQTETEEVMWLSPKFKTSQQYRDAAAIIAKFQTKYQVKVDDAETNYLAIHLARI